MSSSADQPESSSSPPAPAGSSRLALSSIFLTVVIDLLGFGIVLPLLARYARHFEASGWTLALLLASFSMMQFLFAPVWGRLSDRIGRRPVLLIGLAGSCFFYSLFGYATSLGSDSSLLGMGALFWLFVGRIGAGLAGATIPTAQAYIADVTTDAQRSRGMALIGAAFGIGFTFGPLLGAGFVASVTDDPALLLTPAWQAQIPLSTEQQTAIQQRLEADKKDSDSLAKLSRAEQRSHRERRDQEILSVLTAEQRQVWKALSAPTSAPGYLASLLSGLAFILAWFKLPEPQVTATRDRSRAVFGGQHLQLALARPLIVYILMTMFLCTFAFALFESTLNLLTDALGMTDRQNYFVFAYVGLILCLAQGFFVRRMLPRLGEFVMSLAGTVLMTVGLALVGLSGLLNSTGLLYAVLPVSVIGFSCLTPSLQSLLSRRSSAEDQGGILGVGQSALALARIGGQMGGALLNEWDPTAPHFCGSGLMCLGLFFVLGLSQAVPKPAAPDQPADSKPQ